MGSCKCLIGGLRGCPHCVGVGSMGEHYSSHMLSSNDSSFAHYTLLLSAGGGWLGELAPCTGERERCVFSLLHSSPSCRVRLVWVCSLVSLQLVSDALGIKGLGEEKGDGREHCRARARARGQRRGIHAIPYFVMSGSGQTFDVFLHDFGNKS